jgi:hypothetical protein
MSEQVREPMETPSPSGPLARRSPTFWVIVVVVLALNIWYDYYHPLGILFDVVLAVVLFIWCLSKSKPA